MDKLIKRWDELQGLESENYMINVDRNKGSAYIVPKVETEETMRNYYDHHIYLSTHTFYGTHYKESTNTLKHFGFDVEIDNLDKD